MLFSEFKYLMLHVKSLWLAGIVTLGSALVGCAQPEKPNVVIFLVDMLRPDHLGIYGYDKATSPELDRLAAEGVVFENARSPAPWTLPSTVSLLTGLYPSEHGASHRVIDETTQAITFPTDPEIWLPQRFEEVGYVTAGFHTHPYLRRSVSNVYKAFGEYRNPAVEDPAAEAYTVNSVPWTERMYVDSLYPEAEEWLEEHHDQPFFLYIHVIDVHGPYSKLRLLDEDREAVEAGLSDGSVSFQRMERADLYAPTNREDAHKSLLYDGHVRYVDRFLGRLSAKLEKLGVARETYLAITSDHGEGFGEHGYWGHGRYVYEDQVRVPLVLLGHETVRSRAGRITEQVNTVGLIPTLASLSDLELGALHRARRFDQLLFGKSRTGDWRYPSFSETSRRGGRDALTIDGRLKLITERADGKQRLFDLERDPAERAPAAHTADGRAEATDLEKLIHARSRLVSTLSGREVSRQALDDDELEALKALGYID